MPGNKVPSALSDKNRSGPLLRRRAGTGPVRRRFRSPGSAEPSRLLAL